MINRRKFIIFSAGSVSALILPACNPILLVLRVARAFIGVLRMTGTVSRASALGGRLLARRVLSSSRLYIPRYTSSLPRGVVRQSFYKVGAEARKKIIKEVTENIYEEITEEYYGEKGSGSEGNKINKIIDNVNNIISDIKPNDNESINHFYHFVDYWTSPMGHSVKSSHDHLKNCSVCNDIYEKIKNEAGLERVQITDSHLMDF